MWKHQILLYFGLYFASVAGLIKGTDYERDTHLNKYIYGPPNALWEYVPLNIFDDDDEQYNWEKNLYESMQENKKQLLDDDGPQGVGKAAMNAVVGEIPVAGPIVNAIMSFADILAEKSDWQVNLAKTVTDVVDRKIAQQEAADLLAHIKAIKNSLEIADEAHLATVAWDTRKDLLLHDEYFRRRKLNFQEISTDWIAHTNQSV